MTTFFIIYWIGTRTFCRTYEKIFCWLSTTCMQDHVHQNCFLIKNYYLLDMTLFYISMKIPTNFYIFTGYNHHLLNLWFHHNYLNLQWLPCIDVTMCIVYIGADHPQGHHHRSPHDWKLTLGICDTWWTVSRSGHFLNGPVVCTGTGNTCYYLYVSPQNRTIIVW